MPMLPAGKHCDADTGIISQLFREVLSYKQIRLSGSQSHSSLIPPQSTEQILST